MPAVTLIQHTHCPSVAGNLIDSYNARLCHTVLSGNNVIVKIKNGAGASPTITDDKSNTYTQAVSLDDGSDRIHIFYSANVTNGPRIITASYGAAKDWVQMTVTEYAGLEYTTPVAGTSTNSGSGTALTAGAFTPSVNGCLISNFCEQDTTANEITSWAKDTNFRLLSADVADSIADQDFVQATAASINPAMTMAPSNSWMSVAAAFKPNASNGTLPTAGVMRILRCHHLSMKNADASPTIFFVPSDAGNLLVFTWIVGDHPITSITDNNSNSWTLSKHFVGPGASGNIDVYHVASPTTNNNQQVTVTWSNGAMSTVDSTVWFEFSNAHSTPLGATSTAEGNEAAAGSWIGASITPSADRGFILSVLGAENSGADYISASTPGDFISTTTPPENISPWPADSNNGWMVNYHTTTTTIQDEWTDANGAPQNWGQVQVEFIESPGIEVALSGTITSSATEADIVAGGKTIILTVTGTSWIT